MRILIAALILLLSLPAAAQDLDALFEKGMAAAREAAVTPDEDRRDELLDEAIAAFREMLVADPNLVRVRLELARAFYLKGEDSLARRHFEAVLAGGVPPEVAANVRAFLIEIRARRRWSIHGGFAIAPDTNIGAGSEERTIYIPVFGQSLPFTRDADELTSSGVGLVLWGGGEYQYPTGPTTRLRAGANVSRRDHSGSQFDEASLAVHLGPRALLTTRTEASALLTARQNWAGTVKDHHALGGRIEAAHRVSRSVTVNGRVSLEDRHYRTRTGLDGPAGDISLSGAWVVSPTVRLDLSAGYGRDRPARERDRNERYRVGAGISVALPRGFTVSGGGDYRWTNFEPGWSPYVQDNGARKDETWSARASVYNRGLTLMGFSPELGIVHEVRTTNAQLYDYERTSGELRFVRQF
ncbi:MAG: surface lipoprotein assembly modifier [Chloroflexi bacterium]|nr:surface lipoprotein assembly modifier [Chloroflexota bacterium]